MSLKNKLNRYKKHIKTAGSDGELPKIQTSAVSVEEIPYLNVWKELLAKPHIFEDTHCFIREISYPINYQHGRYKLGELHDVIKLWEKTSYDHPLSAKKITNGSDLIFFDTETTGLGSGTGYVIFMIGVAQVLKDEVKIKQYFLPGPGSEVPFYHSFLDDVQLLDSLVTYNGKAFDWPKVKTRHTFIKDSVPKLPEFGHFDLLHAARRLWKDKLESVRLSVVESEILGISRENDTPGHLAPILYFDYLKTKDPQHLKGVFHHNEIDVLSLITLYIHLSYLILKNQEPAFTTKERFESARWFAKQGNIEEAVKIYSDLLKCNEKESVQSMKELALIYKKLGRFEEAVKLLEKYTSMKSTPDIEALIEIAKIYEHKLKNIAKALFFAQLAYSEWKQTSKIFKEKAEKDKIQFKQRINRLNRKYSS